MATEPFPGRLRGIRLDRAGNGQHPPWPEHTVLAPEALGTGWTQTSDECAFEDCPEDGTEHIATTFDPGVAFAGSLPIVLPVTLRVCEAHHQELTGPVITGMSISFVNPED